MSSAILKTIQSEFVPIFKEKIPAIFKCKLEFAFICGGFSKGYADETHDIDMFICVSGYDRVQVEQFREWYFTIHNYYGLPCDNDNPGEIVQLSKLRTAINLLENFTINKFTVDDYNIYEAIVWADMLSENVIGITGNLALLGTFQHECQGYPQKWQADIFKMLTRDEVRYWERYAPQLLMEKYMNYPKNK